MLRQCWHEQGTNPAVPVPLEGASSSILGDPATSVFVVGAGFARKRPESPPNGLGAFGRPNRSGSRPRHVRDHFGGQVDGLA